MSIGRYLPSAQLTLIVVSLAASAGLVFGADYLTTAHNAATASVETSIPDNTSATNNQDWEATLYAIQAASASSSLIAPNPQTVQQMLAAVQSPNLTETIGKTILINLGAAKSQGLGDDIPTQEQIIAAAATQIKNQQASPSNYTAADLTVVPVSNASLHTYGNEVMQVLSRHPDASEKATLLSIDYAVEGGDKKQGVVLASIGAAYKAAATDLLTVSVPQTLVPLQLEVINNLVYISTTYADMQTIGSDPIRGLVGLKTYQSLMDAGAQVFTNIAQELSKDGILFTKDEPGAAWSAVFLTQ